MSRSKKQKPAEAMTPEMVIRKRIRRLSDREEIFSFIGKLVCMILLLGTFFGVVFGITPMQNNDMSPRISARDLMLYYRLEHNLHSQDVVVFEKDGTQYTGRIVAAGGDRVEITEDSRLKINGSPVVETDIYYSTARYGDQVAYPLTLLKGQYFILCDHREGAKDSRYFGPVEQREIKGKVITVIRRSGL
ncbi:signal peptidase I [Lacrimispora sp. JR3]|uniref:signal peptidase I n=1 Tax=Lacrimispora sinapis TaxID=3111456 RepID=UPI003749F4DB